MKRTILLSSMILLALVSLGQITPEDYLNSAPDATSDVCLMKGDAKSKFQQRITELTDSLVAVIDRENTKSNEIVEENADEMGAGALRNVGFKGVNARKVKNAEHMSDAEVEALANQMIQQRLNMSMGDIKDLDKLDSTGQKAWAEGVATEQMANAQSNPEQAQAEQLRIKSQYNLASQQKSMLDKRFAVESKFRQQLDSLDRDANKAKVKLDIRLKPLFKELESASEERAVSINKQIHGYQDEYCQQFTPQYLEILTKYKVHVWKVLPDIKKQEANQNKLTRSQTGVAKDILQPNLMGLEEVKAYYFMLGNIFKYKLY